MIQRTGRAGGGGAFDHGEPVGHARGVLVLTLEGGRISAITRFDNSAMPYFGVPETLPADHW